MYMSSMMMKPRRPVLFSAGIQTTFMGPERTMVGPCWACYQSNKRIFPPACCTENLFSLLITCADCWTTKRGKTALVSLATSIFPRQVDSKGVRDFLFIVGSLRRRHHPVFETLRPIWRTTSAEEELDPLHRQGQKRSSPGMSKHL